MRRREFFKLVGATVTLPLLSKLSPKSKSEPKLTDGLDILCKRTDGFVKGWVFNEGASFDRDSDHIKVNAFSATPSFPIGTRCKTIDGHEFVYIVLADN